MAFNEARLQALRARMAAEQLQVLYVRGLSNIAWLSGFEGVYDTEPAHSVVVTANTCVLHSDSRYAEALRAAAAGTPIQLDVQRKSHGAFLKEQLAALGATKMAGTGAIAASPVRVGIETTVSLAEFRSLEALLGMEQPVTAGPDAAVAPGPSAASTPAVRGGNTSTAAAQSPAVQLVELTGFIEQAREVKDATELAAMRKAQAITDAAFKRIIAYMKPGMTEAEVRLALDTFLYEEGAHGLAFETIVATGAHAASPHAIAGQTTLVQGDAVVMDFGATYNGYCSDMTRTVFMGTPSAELQKAWQVLRCANEECEAMVRPGITGAAVHAHAEEVLAAGGFAGCMGHSLGHSVGIDVHEAPNLAPSNHAELVAGNVVTVEPGIYLPGKFGMRLEDYGVVTQTGFKVFTQSTHEMVIIENC